MAWLRLSSGLPTVAHLRFPYGSTYRGEQILHTLLWGFDFKEGMRGVQLIDLGPFPSGEGLKLTVGD